MPLQTVRSFLNLLFLGVWTAFMVSLAVTLGVLRRDPELFRRMQRRWAAGLVKVWGVRVVVHGAEHMDTNRNYVVMSNHVSYADIVALFLALPVIPGFLAKRELTRIPFLAQALRSGGHVVIDRGQSTAVQTIQAAAQQVREGKTVLIFPEGTRGDSDAVGTFKKGGFYLAKAAGVSILPVGLRGSRAIFPRGAMLVRPGTVEVHIGPALPPEQIAALPEGRLRAAVRDEIVALTGTTVAETVPGPPPSASARAQAR